MNKIKFNRATLLTAFGMLALGLLIGWFARPNNAAGESHDEHNMGSSEASKATEWTCSMHPQIRRQEPGQCPICGMDLIPLDEDQSADDPMEISMSPRAMQLANIQTAVVGFGNPGREVRLNGKIQPDERRVFSQVTHIEGRVEELAVNFTGEPVRKGQKLASVYSPELVTAQEELFSAMKIRDQQPALFAAAKEKLKNWKLSDQQIEQIIAAGKPQERFSIQADVSGIVMEKMVSLGDYLMRGMPLYKIVDLSTVWVLFDVYESDISSARVGSSVSFTVRSMPGESFTGKISFVDPVIDPMTRVARARVEVPNPGGKLKPEMFATGVLKTTATGKKESLIVPKSAVLWTGERSVVYVKKTSDRGIAFLMQDVRLGPSAGDGYVIEEGLDPGTEIAVNGVFSIDAAAQLAGKPSMMNPGGGAAKTGHDHGGNAPSVDVPPVMPNEPGKQAKVAVQQLFDLYFPLKDVLVKGELSAAVKQVGDLKSGFEKTSMSLFSGKAHDHWMSHSGAALETLNKMALSKDVEEIRALFKPLSAQMVALAKAFGPFDETIFVQHCPMADNNNGADWLSLEKQIRNPYFGDKMLTCGSVTETIK